MVFDGTDSTHTGSYSMIEEHTYRYREYLCRISLILNYIYTNFLCMTCKIHLFISVEYNNDDQDIK